LNHPRLFYLCDDHDRPVGGQKHTYQHVDVLNRRGWNACVVHREKGVRLSWFENDTRVCSLEEFQAAFDRRTDFVIVPEDLGADILKIDGRKVIFNKNIFRGFMAFGRRRPSPDPYRHHDTVAAFVVSTHNAEQLRYAYPELDIFHVVMDLRPGVFTFEPLSQKKRQVVSVIKGRGSAAAYQMFQARVEAGLIPRAPGDWMFLDGLSERNVAEVLRESLILVFQSVEEGLGRLPLEALLAGCVVIGYSAGPLKGVLPPQLCAAYANPVELCRLIESVLSADANRLQELQELVLKARDQALQYSSAQQEQSVCLAWQAIVDGTRGKARPDRVGEAGLSA
jgi:hypothetical protein